MAGHSKWSNIKRRKGKQDEIRGRIFTKIAKEIMVAVKQGGPDPEGNFRLKLCIQKAKDNNMPNDNIERAIKKASGSDDAETFEEIYYEGYGPDGVAFMCEILTDNRNRIASEIRFIFSRNNGNLGATGCVSWMFKRKGRLTIDMAGQDEDELMMVALDAGADDFSVDQENDEAEIITEVDSLESVRSGLIDAGIVVKEAEINMIPVNTVAVNELAKAEKILGLMEALEENDDVQNVYHNADVPDDILAQLG